MEWMGGWVDGWMGRWVDGEKVAEVNEIAQSILLCREKQYRLEMQACWRSQQPSVFAVLSQCYGSTDD
ncbi:MAG: hypothetical protein AAFX78_10995 [Cyanobacteria bacterium J06638_20]